MANKLASLAVANTLTDIERQIKDLHQAANSSKFQEMAAKVDSLPAEGLNEEKEFFYSIVPALAVFAVRFV